MNKLALGILALSSVAAAQQGVTPVPVQGPVRDAGIYHAATGTWSRANTPGSSTFGPDVIYSATAQSGYWGVVPGRITDEGILPGPAHPEGGSQDQYFIDGFSIAYCSNGFDDIELDLQFYDSYTPCDVPSAPVNCINSVSSMALAGLPNDGCWFLTIDLSGGMGFCMQADGGPCNPGYQGGDLDHFGWSHKWTGTGGTAVASVGSILAGYQPNWASGGQGTCYNPNSTCGANTGLGAQDLFAVDDWDFQANPGCYWFGGYVSGSGCGAGSGNPGGQFFLELYTDCDNDCSSHPCTETYCDTSGLQNGTLSLDNCSVSAGSNILTASNVSPNTQFAYFNISADNNSVWTPPGSIGELCLGGGGRIGRYIHDLQFVNAGTYSVDLWNGNTGGGTGALPYPPGGQIHPGATWNFQGWHNMGPGAAATWSDALTVTFRP